MKKYIVILAKEERETLDALTSKGKHQSHKIPNALILLGCVSDETLDQRSNGIRPGIRTCRIMNTGVAVCAIFFSPVSH